jgi:3-oxoacyl-[acyl-carrier-protein] synthase II
MADVIVSGMGAICALGTNVDTFWNRLLSGQSGIQSITAFERENLRNIHAGEINISSDLLEYAERSAITSRLSLFSNWAIEQSIADSGINLDLLKRKRTAIIIGTSLGMSLVEGTIEYVPGQSSKGVDLAEDLSKICSDLAQRYPVSGEILLLSTACASGTHAIGLAKDMMLYEGYDIIICGGADSLDRMKYLGHSALNTLTVTTIQPCSESRNGTLFGEGAAFLVLEKEKTYSGKRPDAFCSGAGYSCDAYHVTMPDPKGNGAIYAMKDALRDAAIEPKEIGYINLHGSGTPLNDSVEGLATMSVFGAYADVIPASSIKSSIGHTMGAAGALEAVSTIMSIVDRKVPATLNVGNVDPALKLNIVHKESLECTIDHAMSNSFGFGGSNGSLVFSKC